MTQLELFESYSKGELKYVKTIKRWLKNEISFFKELQSLENEPVEKPKSKFEALSSKLSEFRFFDLSLVSCLSPNGQNQLLEMIAVGSLPYQIAMFNHIGFLTHLKDAYFSSQFKLYKSLAHLLSSDERTVKGNISVLIPNSRENKARYTAHMHKEQVVIDYQKIK